MISDASFEQGREARAEFSKAALAAAPAGQDDKQGAKKVEPKKTP